MTIPRFPLTWPDGWRRTPTLVRRDGQFRNQGQRLGISSAAKRIMEELRRLGVDESDAVISTNLKTRLDGMPRADQPEPADGGAAVYWTDKAGRTKVMAIDQYKRVADNLGAVAATLEAMRAIERHGGGEILERSFTGFDALPPPKSPWDILGCSAAHATEESIQAAYKSRLRSSHPAAGGSENAFLELNVARDKALAHVRARGANA